MYESNIFAFKITYFINAIILIYGQNKIIKFLVKQIEADKKSFSFRSFHRRYFVSKILKGEFNICLEDTHRKLFYWQYIIDHYKTRHQELNTEHYT